MFRGFSLVTDRKKVSGSCPGFAVVVVVGMMAEIEVVNVEDVAGSTSTIWDVLVRRLEELKSNPKVLDTVVEGI